MGIETFVNQYVNLYNPKRKTYKKEGFENGESKTEEKSNLVFILWIFLIIYAVYLSWKCNNQKLELIHFLFALMCAPVYILYQLASNGLECVTK
jgi:hypothetical protein